jgi:hypothetical protein
MIRGKRVGQVLPKPVDVVSIEKLLREADLLPRKLVPRVSVVEISHDQFEAIRNYVLKYIGESKDI